MDIRDRRLKARLSKWSTCSVETKRGLVKPRKVTMFKRFLSYYEPQMGLFVADTVCALVLAAIDLAFPIILRNLTGGLFTQGQAAIMQALGMIAVGLVLMYAVRCACRYFVSYWGHVMGARMESKMREDLFDQYERFSFAYFDRNSSGDMMSRVVNDLFDICEAAHHVPEWIIICGIEIIGSFVILFTIAPVLALAMAVVTAAFSAIMFWQNMRMREVFSDNRKKISGINAQLQDSLAGMRVVKSFANEETERAKFRASNDRYLSSKENMYHAMGVYTATYGLLSGVLYVIVVLLGGWLLGTVAGANGYAANERISSMWALFGEYWAALFCLLGHMFPCMFHFKGGKGILSGGTIAIMIDWRIALVVWGGFLLLAVLTRYVSLGSCWAGASFPFATWFVYHDVFLTVFGACLGCLILYMHRGNIQRLLSGTENKFSLHHKKE